MISWTNTRTHIQAYVHIYVHIYTHINTQLCMTCIYACMHTYACNQTYIHIDSGKELQLATYTVYGLADYCQKINHLRSYHSDCSYLKWFSQLASQLLTTIFKHKLASYIAIYPSLHCRLSNILLQLYFNAKNTILRCLILGMTPCCFHILSVTMQLAISCSVTREPSTNLKFCQQQQAASVY